MGRRKMIAIMITTGLFVGGPLGYAAFCWIDQTNHKKKEAHQHVIH